MTKTEAEIKHIRLLIKQLEIKLDKDLKNIQDWKDKLNCLILDKDNGKAA